MVEGVLRGGRLRPTILMPSRACARVVPPGKRRATISQKGTVGKFMEVEEYSTMLSVARWKTVTGQTIETSNQKKGVMAMRFMMLMIPKGYERATPGAMPDAKAVAAMMEYNA